MAIKIKFDGKNMPSKPTILLAKRSGEKLRIIPDTSSMHISDNLNSPTDISFSISKTENNASVWNEIKNFRKVWIPEYDKWFTLTYEVSESNELIKNITLVPNTEFELSNVNVHNLEINTESDILREDYVEPTVFYAPNHPEYSLLDRILSFTMGFTIKHVDNSLRNIQRTFSLDGQNVYDTLNTIAEEFQCLFVYDSGTLQNGQIERAISAYDLRSRCNYCGYRGDFNSTCPRCDSSDISLAYGTDTPILVDTDGLANDINLATNTDAVKNCFRLLAGDDLMNAAIIASNPNGTQYLWYFTDEMKEDMSQVLKTKLSDYDEDYEYYENTYEVPINSDLLDDYNELVDKYDEYKTDLEQITSIIGYANLMNAAYDVMDFQIYLESELLPAIEMDTSAAEQAANITAVNMPEVAVQNLTSASQTTVENAVTSAMRIVIDVRYTAKIATSSYNSSTHVWTGAFTVTSNSDRDDTATSSQISISISDTYETFARQKIEKAVAQLDKNSYSTVKMFNLGINQFVAELKKYSRDALNSILTACNGAIGVMVEMGISNPTSAALVEGGLESYTYIYLPYVQKLRAIEAEIKVRDNEVATIQNLYDAILDQKEIINDTLDIVNYLGQTLATELTSYKMEDDYQNSNYISEGLTNDELFKKASEFINVANTEIHKAATETHTISTNMNNLLTIDEFKPLVDYFSVGNWIRIKVNGVVYRVRLLSYSIDFDNINSLQVEFSDVVGTGETSIADIFASAKSMAKSYDSIKHQAETSLKTKFRVDDWVKKGLDLTTVRILNARNQTMVLDDTGMSMKQWDDIAQDYSDFQSKWINTTLAFTTDNWETTETALGRFVYYNPRTDQYEDGYGIIAKQLVGDYIIGQNMGIYNAGNTFTIDNNGLVITANGDDNNNDGLFTIQKQYTDDGQTQISKLLYIDEDGNLIFKGTVKLESGKTIEEQLEDLEQSIQTSDTLTVMLSNESHLIPTDENGNNGNYSDCYTQVYVLRGNIDVTQSNSTTITATPSTGVVGSWTDVTNKIYTVTNMTEDNGTVTFTVQYVVDSHNTVTVTKAMSLSKVRSGETSQVYTLSPSTIVVKKSYKGVLTPASVTFNAYVRNGNSVERSAYQGRFIIAESTDGTSFTTQYTSSSNESSKTYTPTSSNVKMLRCSLYVAGGTTTQLDVQSVVIVSDTEGMQIGGRNLIRNSDTLIFEDYGFV